VSHSPTADAGREEVNRYLEGWRATMQLVKSGRSFSGFEKHCVFLNCTDGTFAGVAAVSGLDFDDDGRALAVVDWDQDGDLDLWTHNRTAPRLRLLLNQQPRSSASTLALFLKGTQSVADAIGARVTLRFAEPQTPPQMQTLTAGDGFLSQSSKWLHFGFQAGAKLAAVEVRWPSGNQEVFTGVEAGGRALLVEGAGRTQQQALREQLPGLEVKPQVVQPTDPASQIRLPDPVALPSLTYESFRGALTLPIEAPGKPLLVLLWASWCAPCRAELAHFSEQEALWRAAGLELLALSVDGLDESKGTAVEDGRRYIEQQGLPFQAGRATAEFLHKLELLRGFLFHRSPASAVPFSLLLNEDGSLLALYQGRVGPELVLRDLEAREQSAEERRTSLVPFQGRWQMPPAPVNNTALARLFAPDYPLDAESYLVRAIDDLARRQEAQPEHSAALRREQASTQLLLAKLQRSQGHPEAAVRTLQKAVELHTDFAEAHLLLAQLLQQAGKRRPAAKHYQESLRFDPAQMEVRISLALLLLDLQRVDEAVEQLRQAVDLRPNYARAHNILGTALRRQGRLGEAIQHFQKALELKPNYARAQNNLQSALESNSSAQQKP
jgi:tetratricopeptide (TPR) repeat protein